MENNNTKKIVEQTGFLYKVDPMDYIVGASPLIIPDVNPTGDWREFAPRGEKQYKFATFDTMSCSTFAFLNAVETQVNWHLKNDHFTIAQIETMNRLGFFADGKFNCSDRFTAIMSGTMPNGNYIQKVGDSVRKDGLLPEDLLPFGGNSWAEYHNPNQITQSMKETAKKILDILEIYYEWEVFEPGKGTQVINAALKKSPLEGAIPEQARHAIEIIAPGYYFDSYEPYIKPLPYVRYAMKVIVKVKKPIVSERIVTITRENANGKETLGTLVAKNGQSTFTCKTLELPWKNNARNISCIPTGEYTCRWGFWAKKLRYRFDILNVPNRSGIKIHAGNYYTDIQGCILLGNSFVDMNKDNVLDITGSGTTVSLFEKFMGTNDFKLIIK